MKKCFQKKWTLDFLCFLSIRSIPAVIEGDWNNTLWILWIVWFRYFIPIKKK